ncbi:MAG: hypothetical protein HXY22_05950 [Alphaproteobacteria bacterium]|nr:hypothetical protein [Alphaproteobacteria bacterium]
MHTPVALNFQRQETRFGDLAPARKEAAATAEVFGGDGFDFDDLLDVLNPLQHLPVIGTLYRAITGDEITDGARLIGGTLYGGPVGGLATAADLAFEDATGDTLGDTVLGALIGTEAAPADAPAKADVTLAGATIAPRNYAAPPPAEAATAAPRQIGLKTSPLTAAATPTLSPEAMNALLASLGQLPEAGAPPADAASAYAASRRGTASNE